MERSRHRLYQRLQEVLGAEEATTLMEHLPAGGVGQLATKNDVSEPRDEIQALGDDLVTEIRRLTRELTVSLSIIMAALNGIVFVALKLD